MLKDTKEKMLEFAKTLPASSAKAQCINIANLELGPRTLAQTIREDHSNIASALRAATLMVAAGAAEEVGGTSTTYGEFLFEDGSTLS